MESETQAASISKRGLALNATADQLRSGSTLTMPSIPSLEQGGFTIDSGSASEN